MSHLQGQVARIDRDQEQEVVGSNSKMNSTVLPAVQSTRTVVTGQHLGRKRAGLNQGSSKIEGRMRGNIRSKIKSWTKSRIG